MAKCPLCSRRAPKRHCPARAAEICSVCCGTKREIEIDCPVDCVHLCRGRSFEAERHDPPAARERARFSQQFVYRYGAPITALTEAVLEERGGNPDLVDTDVGSAFTALKATLKTLSSGIYFETLPTNGRAALGLYRRLQAVIDRLMLPGQTQSNMLRASAAIEILDFLSSIVDAHTSGRPRSRQYLKWLDRMASRQPKEERSRIIVP